MIVEVNYFVFLNIFIFYNSYNYNFQYTIYHNYINNHIDFIVNLDITDK